MNKADRSVLVPAAELEVWDLVRLLEFGCWLHCSCVCDFNHSYFICETGIITLYLDVMSIK